jgi:hypothetical protein
VLGELDLGLILTRLAESVYLRVYT